MLSFVPSRFYPYLKKHRLYKKLSNKKMLPTRYPSNLPKQIFMYWDTGLENAPDIVKLCAQSWIEKNPTWNVIILDATDAKKVVNPDELPAMTKIAHYADILRTKLLRDNGGVWVDITCYCVRPLDSWLPPLFNQTDFFALSQPGKDRLISSWFLASTAKNHIMTEWLNRTLDFWSRPPRDNLPYFWFHYLFEGMIKSDRKAAAAFAVMPKISAAPSHIVQKHLARGPFNKEALDRARNSYVQKLTFKRDFTVEDVQLIISELWPETEQDISNK